MPYKIKKKKNGKYTVSSPSGVTAKNTTKSNALSQIRAIEMNKNKKK